MQLFYVVLLTSRHHGNYVDFLAILLTEDVPTATNYFLVALESAKTTVALTETSGQGGPHTNIVRMLTESKTANRKLKLKS